MVGVRNNRNYRVSVQQFTLTNCLFMSSCINAPRLGNDWNFWKQNLSLYIFIHIIRLNLNCHQRTNSKNSILFLNKKFDFFVCYVNRGQPVSVINKTTKKSFSLFLFGFLNILTFFLHSILLLSIYNKFGSYLCMMTLMAKRFEGVSFFIFFFFWILWEMNFIW